MNGKMAMTMALASVCVMAGCVATPQPNAALETARTAVRAAEADANVARYSALDLNSAKQELQTAESAFMHHDRENIDQPAYLAAQTARLAQLKAAAKADDQRVATGQKEREQIMLAARTREVESEKLAAKAAAARAANLQSQVDALKAKRDQ